MMTTGYVGSYYHTDEIMYNALLRCETARKMQISDNESELRSHEICAAHAHSGCFTNKLEKGTERVVAKFRVESAALQILHPAKHSQFWLVLRENDALHGCATRAVMWQNRRGGTQLEPLGQCLAGR